ncbi:MAG: xanthine dehydrogenase family protein subunit M [Candidatus Sumerlaeia bacterium]
MKPFELAIADSLTGALTALTDGFKAKAGGIDLVDRLKERTEEAEKIVCVKAVKELSGGVREVESGVTIGALTTLRDLAASPLLRAKFPALADAAAHAATPQIRAVATVGGNLCQRPRCWYFRSLDFPCLKKRGATCYALEGENHYHALFGGGPCHIVHPSNIAPPLIGAGAEFVLHGPGGRRVVPAGEFFVLPSQSMYAENVLKSDELVSEIRIPRWPSRSAYVEFREKQSFDWPLAACAAVHDGEKWNVVLGAAAPIPWRAAKAEALLRGAAHISPALAEQAADAALDGAQPMSQNAWRLKLVRAAVRRALLLADGKEID